MAYAAETERKMIVNVLGILACYSFLIVLAMPDDFAMPKDRPRDGEDHF